MAVTKVVMPKLSDAMESGKIIKWLKKEGDRIQGGDILAEVETDKADVEMEAFGAGVLRKILAPAGETVPIGALIGVIADPADDISALLASAPAGAASAVAPPPRPAGARIFLRTPAPNASISTSALSVSISARMSPPWIRSPSFFSHLMIFPLSIASESLGITTFVMAMTQLSFALHTRRTAARILSFDGVLSFSRLRA